MRFIKVDLAENPEEGFTSLVFTARDDNDENREALDSILRLLLDPSLKRRGGAVPGNSIRVDFDTVLSESEKTQERG